MKGSPAYAYREDEDGREIVYALTWAWYREVPETRWEPKAGGVEVLDAFRDGEHIGLGDLPNDVYNELLSDAEDKAKSRNDYECG